MAVAESPRRRRDAATTVWIFILSLSVGGAERTIVDIATATSGDRYDVTVWTLFDTNPLAAELGPDVRHRSLGVAATHGTDRYEITGARNPLQYALAPLRFVTLVRRERPDILHSFLFYGNIICRVAGVVAPTTSVINGERGFYNSQRRLLHLVDRATLPLTDTIISNSRAGAEHYHERGIAWTRLRVIPNGRPLQTYRDPAGGTCEDEFDLGASTTVVGTVGRLVARKGHADLLHAWARVQQSVPDSHLLVVGYGPERDSLAELAAILGVSDSVTFTGRREDVPELLATMDVFVFPSHWEGHPGALLEAMAAGLPIVATRIDGNRDLLTDGRTGVLVPPRDPVGLAHALTSLCTDPEFAATIGNHAQSEAFEEYTVETMVDRFESVYRECAAGQTAV